MNDYDPWVTNARAYIGRVGDTVVCGVVTDRGLIHAAPLTDGQDEVHAMQEVLLLLTNHPDLNSVGVDFVTNMPGLRTIVAEGAIDVAGARISFHHVTALPQKAYFPGEPLMVDAR